MRKLIAVMLAGALMFGLTGCQLSVLPKKEYEAMKSELSQLRQTVAEGYSYSDFENYSDYDYSDYDDGEPVQVRTVQATQTAYYFEADDDGELWGAYAAEITNTHGKAILITDYAVDFLDAEGRIVLHEEDWDATPAVLQPGEKAYFGSWTYTDTVQSPKVIQTMRVKVIAEETPITLKAPVFGNLNPMKNSYNEIQVTGEVTNTMEKDVDSLPIVVVLFGEEDKLLAAEHTYVDDFLEGDTMSFSVGFSDTSVPLSAVKRVEAFGYDQGIVNGFYY